MPNKESLESKVITGPVYGDKVILYKQGTGFQISPYPVGEKKAKDLPVIEVTSFISANINEYGLSMERFSDVELNQYGYKTVATHLEFELCLTATGTFVVYHNGLPSLPGLACPVQSVSGIWVDKNFNTIRPCYSIMTKEQMISSYSLCQSASFRPIHSSVFNNMPKEKVTPLVGEGTESVYDCDCYLNRKSKSCYTDRHPKFNSFQLYEYKRALAEQEVKTVSLPELIPEVIADISIYLNAGKRELVDV